MLFSTCNRTIAEKNSDGKFPVTMIPGDGVGPELMDSVQVVMKSIGTVGKIHTQIFSFFGKELPSNPQISLITPSVK